MIEDLWTLRNENGVSASVTSYGAALVSVLAPDRNGQLGDVVLGFDSLYDYRHHDWYCGATIGRYAGRIRDARFTLDGRHYELSANEGPHHLHGGARGFDKVVWESRFLPEERTVRMRHISPDGDQGYAGTLDAAVAFTLTETSDLIIDFVATTDRATPINLTNHTYFNLAGAGDILGHEITINAEQFAEIDESTLPTGKLFTVRDTPLDFRNSRRIGEQLPTDGYDHDFLVSDAGPEYLGARFAARVHDPASGRVLEVFTTEPVLHFYSGGFIRKAPRGKGGAVYAPYSGLALETQHFSDSPNQPAFPSTILRPGESFRARTIFRFSVAGAT